MSYNWRHPGRKDFDVHKSVPNKKGDVTLSHAPDYIWCNCFIFLSVLALFITFVVLYDQTTKNISSTRKKTKFTYESTCQVSDVVNNTCTYCETYNDDGSCISALDGFEVHFYFSSPFSCIALFFCMQ